MPSVRGIVFESKACHSFPNVRLKEQLEQVERHRYCAIQLGLDMTNSNHDYKWEIGMRLLIRSEDNSVCIAHVRTNIKTIGKVPITLIVPFVSPCGAQRFRVSITLAPSISRSLG